MAMQGPPDLPGYFDEATYAQLELGFVWLFTFEMGARVLAMGFSGHSYSYMADPWNWLDAFVVLMSWLPLLIPALGNYSAVRAVRALRPLRTISRLPKLKRQVDTLIECLPYLFDVAMLGTFILVIYGVLGVQLFKGVLRFRCYEPSAPLTQPVDALTGVCAPEADAALAVPSLSAAADGRRRRLLLLLRPPPPFSRHAR